MEVHHRFAARRLAIASLGAVLVLGSLPAAANMAPPADRFSTYSVTLQNLTTGQPLSPPVVATHRSGIRLFRVGRPVSGEAELLAEDGNEQPMVAYLSSSRHVTEVVDVGAPLPPAGPRSTDRDSSVTIDIQARRGDRLSLATMLVCTNDGFTGLDRARLPRGSRIFLVPAYDAGSEENTELSGDIPDQCSELGPLQLPGDPNGNEDTAVDSVPHQSVAIHLGIAGGGDLGVEHAWDDPVALVTVVRLADGPGANKFSASLSGLAEVPPVLTNANGEAELRVERHANSVRFKVQAQDLLGVTAAHLHLGAVGVDGPIVAPLAAVPRRGDRAEKDHDEDEVELEGRISESDLVGPLAGDFAGFLEALRSGQLYVNVHTAAYPDGELRGQLGAGEEEGFEEED